MLSRSDAGQHAGATLGEFSWVGAPTTIAIEQAERQDPTIVCAHQNM